MKGSGRTDAGVHALGQVANFHTLSTMIHRVFYRALNSVLPPTIVVTGADEVDAAFDAQFSAVNKLYRYRVFNSRDRSPFELRRSWHVNTTLDVESMSSLSRILLGKKDFSSFRASGCVARDPVRTLSRCEITRDGDIISFELEADGFLRHMVRNIVGTLVDVGRHRFSTDDFAEILDARDRTRAGRAAPPHGLYLVRVDYPLDESPRAHARPHVLATAMPRVTDNTITLDKRAQNHKNPHFNETGACRGVAQGESACLTRKRSAVQDRPSLPDSHRPQRGEWKTA